MIVRFEKILIISFFTAYYFWVFLLPEFPVFLHAFNSVDGSIYVVRTWDLLISLLIFLPICYYLIPTVLNREEVSRFLVLSVVLLIAASGLEFLLDRLVVLMFNLPTGEHEISDKALNYREILEIESSIIPGNLILFGISILYGLSRDWVLNFRNRARLKRDTMRAELSFLRSQINPHFLFNTLNSMYAMARRNSDQQTGDAILQLSGIMRYMLQASDSQSVDLGTEIEQIENYLSLVRLRFSSEDPLKIEFTHELVMQEMKISPLMLMPFVENAVKHGLSSDGNGYLKIDLRTNEERIRFNVVNSISPKKIELTPNSGIGLRNVKRRLEVLYPDRHELTVTSQQDVYTIELVIESQG
jgi:two-component system, LytTR family, sensor kinase